MTSFHFGPFELNESRWELRRRGITVPIQRKALDTVLFLIRRRDRVVSRDELRAGVWPNTAVTETTIGHAVMQVRRALEDTDGHWIKTVRGKGLRFAGPAVEIEGTATPGPDSQRSNEVDNHLLQCFQVLFRTVVSVAHSASPSSSLLEPAGSSGTSEDVLWELAQRFRSARQTAAARQTLEYLVERFPTSRLAQQANAHLTPTRSSLDTDPMGDRYSSPAIAIETS